VGIYNVAHGRGDAEYGQAGIWENLVVNLTGSSAERIKRLNAIADTLKEQDLDIIILNEADFRAFWSDNINQARYIASRTGHAHVLEQRNHDLDLPFFDIKFGNAVLSRYPIVSAASLDFPAYRWWENVLLGRKKGAVCEIRLSENQTVRLVPVHLDVRSTEVRIESVKVIQELCDRTEHPMVAAGDFNSTRPGWPKAEPNAEGQTAVGYLTQVGCFHTLPREEFTEADFTFASSDPVKVIDWIMVSDPLKIVDRQVLDAQDLSDHFPVVATIKTDENRF
jgi:endonuclease/exonuclease/phosphatase family metal-dependent hydrolase